MMVAVMMTGIRILRWPISCVLSSGNPFLIFRFTLDMRVK